MSEWLKEHAWKACVPQKGIEGSNPSLSANYKSIKRLSASAGSLFCISYSGLRETAEKDWKCFLLQGDEQGAGRGLLGP